MIDLLTLLIEKGMTEVLICGVFIWHLRGFNAVISEIAGALRSMSTEVEGLRAEITSHMRGVEQRFKIPN